MTTTVAATPDRLTAAGEELAEIDRRLHELHAITSEYPVEVDSRPGHTLSQRLRAGVEQAQLVERRALVQAEVLDLRAEAEQQRARDCEAQVAALLPELKARATRISAALGELEEEGAALAALQNGAPRIGENGDAAVPYFLVSGAVEEWRRRVAYLLGSA